MLPWSYEGMGYLRYKGEIVLQILPKPGKGWTNTTAELALVERIVALLNADGPQSDIQE